MTSVNEAARKTSAVANLSWMRWASYYCAGYALYGLSILLHRSMSLWYKFRPYVEVPHLIKTYACRPSQPVRLFFPSSYGHEAAASSARLPVIFTIHGGGFVIGSAEDMDVWNYTFTRKHPILIVSLNYSKSPVWPFPYALHDLEAVILAVLADESLPIDRSRVAVLGWSAGGNLALAVSSLPSMNGSGIAGASASLPKIHAAIPIYPAVDMSLRSEKKLLGRQYKAIPGLRGRPGDYLSGFMSIFDLAYSRGRQDTTNPLISPTYTPKESLPPYVFMLACELDMLALEAWLMICRLAGRPEPAVSSKVGSSDVAPHGELILDDERYAFEERTENSSYRWLLVPDVVHAFDQITFREPITGEDFTLKRDKSQDQIAAWLFSGPFAKKGSTISS